MKKSYIKKITAYAVVIALVGTGGVLKLCKDKSDKFASKTYDYINEAVDDDFLIAAHRGFSSLEVENTENAFIEANNAWYVDYIELDVRMTADGELVCGHNDSVVDDELQKRKISEMTSEDIFGEDFKYFGVNFKAGAKSLFSVTEGSLIRDRNMNILGKSYSISSLDSALDLCDDKKILIDLKFNDNFEDFSERLMEVIMNYDTDRIVLQSANLKLLKKLQELYPEYNYLGIISKEEDFEKCESFQMIGVRKNLIDSKCVVDALNDGKQLSIWTINTTHELETVADSLGDSYQDVIYVTDYPDIMASHLDTIKLEKKKVTTQ